MEGIGCIHSAKTIRLRWLRMSKRPCAHLYDFGRLVMDTSHEHQYGLYVVLVFLQSSSALLLPGS
eukprot:2231581-Amphidinium_carterae.1